MFSVKSPPIWDDIMLKLPRPDHHDGLYDHWSLSSYLSTPSCLKLCFHKSYPTISVEPRPWFSPANILSSKTSCGQAPTSEDEAWWTEGNAVGWRALLCAPASSSWNYSPPSHYSLFNLTSSTHTLCSGRGKPKSATSVITGSLHQAIWGGISRQTAWQVADCI